MCKIFWPLMKFVRFLKKVEPLITLNYNNERCHSSLAETLCNCLEGRAGAFLEFCSSWGNFSAVTKGCRLLADTIFYRDCFNNMKQHIFIAKNVPKVIPMHKYHITSFQSSFISQVVEK